MPYYDITYKIRGAFHEIHNELGAGYGEEVYRKALAKELKDRGLSFVEDKHLPVAYKGEKVGKYDVDFIVDGKIIIEVRALPELPKGAEALLHQHLKGTEYTLGYIVNFGAAKLDIRKAGHESGT